MFEYVVKYWSDDEQRVMTSRGILAADSYASATQEAYDFCKSPEQDLDGIISIYISELDNPLVWEDIKDWVEEKKKQWD